MKNPAGLAKKWDFLQKCLRKKLLFRPLWGENIIFSRWAFAMGFCWWLKPEKMVLIGLDFYCQPWKPVTPPNRPGALLFICDLLLKKKTKNK